MEAREAHPSEQVRSELIALLTTHQRELAKTLATRLLDTDLGIEPNDEDVTWIQLAAEEALSSLIAAFEEGDQWTGPLPPMVVARIRYAARRGISLDNTLRSFAMVGTVVFEFFASKFDELPLSQETLRYALSWQGQNYDRIMNAFATEHAKEVKRLQDLPSRHLTEAVESLLEGGAADHADLDYRLDAFHVGLIAAGERAALECRHMAQRLGCDLLILPRAEDLEGTEEVVWAWLGARRPIEFEQLEQLAGGKRFLFLAAGEVRRGLDGWRLTHREAQAALGVALLQPGHLTRHSDVALVGHALRSEATARSLLDRYVRPLDRHRDSGELRRTVRTYLDLDCNAASAASALGVNRHTVQRRLKRTEEAIGRPLARCRGEIDVALQLERLTAQANGTARSLGAN